jgi:dephospho-CoA kinase
MVIGLTGQIGAGKTTVAKILTRLGAFVIDADQIGREVVEQSNGLRQKLVKVFGSEIVDSQGHIRRKKLAAVAFTNHSSKQKLNGLVHPYLLKELRRQVRVATKNNQVVVIDAALLLFWGIDREVDFVLTIHASKSDRFSRVAARGITREDAAARQQAQLPFREFQTRSDRVILNNGTHDQLIAKVKRLYLQMVP